MAGCLYAFEGGGNAGLRSGCPRECRRGSAGSSPAWDPSGDSKEVWTVFATAPAGESFAGADDAQGAEPPTLKVRGGHIGISSSLISLMNSFARALTSFSLCSEAAAGRAVRHLDFPCFVPSCKVRTCSWAAFWSCWIFFPGQPVPQQKV
jgi:hypothetical protein